MKGLLYVLLSLSILYYNPVSSFFYSSSRRVGGVSEDQLQDLSFTSNRGVVSTGYFTGTANYGNSNLTSNGYQSDIFLAQYDENLNPVWSKSFGYSGPDKADAVSVDSNNNIYITGTFKSSINFGGGNMTCSATSCSSLFLVKFDTNGNFGWNTQYFMNAAYATAKCPGLAVHTDGSFLIGGQFSPAITFGTTTYTFLGGTDAFLAKLNSTGAPLWSAALQGTGDEMFEDVSFDSSGNSVAVGWYNSQTSLAGTSISWNSSADALLVKFNLTGSLEWYFTLSTNGSDKLVAVATDYDGNILAGGQCGNSFVIGGLSVTCNRGQFDIILLKISSSGLPLWALSYGSVDGEAITDIAIGMDNSIMITGYYTDSVSLGGYALVNSTSTMSSYVAKYSSEGNHTWSAKASTWTSSRIQYDSISGRIAFGSSFTYNNVTIMGGPVLYNAGSSDFYLAVFDEVFPSPSVTPSASVPAHSSSEVNAYSMVLLIILLAGLIM